jgi:hypothetical protein
MHSTAQHQWTQLRQPCTSAQETILLLGNLDESTFSTQNTTRQNYQLFALAISVMKTRSTSTSDDPRPSSPTPTTTSAERHRLQQFNETQRTSTNLISAESFQAVGIEGDTNAAGREPVRLFDTEDGVHEYEEDERGRVLGIFEVDVSTSLPTIPRLIVLLLTCS